MSHQLPPADLRNEVGSRLFCVNIDLCYMIRQLHLRRHLWSRLATFFPMPCVLQDETPMPAQVLVRLVLSVSACESCRLTWRRPHLLMLRRVAFLRRPLLFICRRSRSSQRAGQQRGWGGLGTFYGKPMVRRNVMSLKPVKALPRLRV